MRRLVTLLLLTFALEAAAANQGLERGFSPQKLYDFGSIDAINTFNGNLTLSIPLGGTYPVNGAVGYSFGLFYNSKVWDYEQVNSLTRAVPNRRANAGLGWLLSPGRLISPTDPINETNAWIYESPDGASHEFTTTLHGQAPAFSAPVTAVRYTTDGSYIRMQQKNDGTIDLEFPDGAVHTFTTSTGKLSRIRDRFANSVSVWYSSDMTGTPCPSTDNYVWTFTDSKLARSNYVCFSNLPYPDSSYEGQVERVVLAAPPAADGTARTATYQFSYEMPTPHVSRGCHSTYFPEDELYVPLLRSILLPDGSSYAFEYNYTATNAACEQGTLKSARLPTLATHTYKYRYYEVPVDECGATQGKPNSNITGVGERTISGPRVPLNSKWTYTSSLSPRTAYIQCELPSGATVSIPGPSEEMAVTVTDPLGFPTVNYYSVWPGADNQNSAAGFRASEYGLPFTRHQSTTTAAGTTVYLSTRVSEGTTAKRSLYVRYPEPSPQPCYTLADCGSGDPRVIAQRVLHHDDGSSMDTVYSDFDGLGHFRRTTTSGTTGTGAIVSGGREVFVAYNTRDPEVNPASGIHSGSLTDGTFIAPPVGAAWLINSSSYADVTEKGVTARTQSCFDGTTGFLRAVRTLKTGTTRGSTDTVAVYTPEPGTGNVASETYFGGDIKNNASTSTPLCTMATSTLPAHDYKIDHTYEVGLRKTSKYSGASFFHLNRTIDRSTGVTLTSTNSSGSVTTYTYDVPGRLIVEEPPNLLGIYYTYAKASGSTPASVLVKHGARQNQYQFDALGRLWREKTYMPGNTWSVRETLYDRAGHVESKSEQEKLVITTNEWAFVPAHKTTFGNFDAFGRARLITAPDGKTTTMTYTSARSVARTVNINDTNTAVAVRENYDLLGRLESVTEAIGHTQRMSTTYTYDVGGRLKSVAMPSGGGAIQNRFFNYDNRGFLNSEQHPELGASGNGTRSYLQYDARGHAHQQITGTAGGAFDLSFTFDPAERVTNVRLTGSNQTLKEFAYDDPTGALYPQCTGGLCNGKLAAAARYNYASDLGGTIVVTEAYQYNGWGGTVSRRDLAVGSTPIFTGDAFNASQNYTSIGDLQTLYYPCRTDGATASGCNGSDQPRRAVVNSYTNGYNTGVGSIASAITYAPNGMIDTVTHGSGATAVKETIVSDPNMARPCGIFVYGPGVTLNTDSTAPCGRVLSGTGAQWFSGAYAYDGVGNITRIGGNTYRYDPLGRLASWTTAAGTTDRTYDNFGNAIGAGLTVDGTTNRYSGMAYDAAGNVTNDGNGTYTYDALGMMTGTNALGGRNFRYIYTPDDERVAAVERVVVGGAVRTKTTWTLRGLGPQLQRVYVDDNTSGARVFSWKEDVFWRGSQLLGTDTPGGLRHHGLDHLGSPRIVTDASGVLLGTQDFTPFGIGGTSDGGTNQFTGQERDAASLGGGSVDLADYFHARYYRANAGRFLSVDPVLDLERALIQPQSWNRYSYTMNNPLSYTDPSGEIINLANLTDEQRRALLASLNEFTGNTYDVNDSGNLVAISYGSGASAKATGFLEGAMAASDVYTVTGVNGDSDVIFAEANTATNEITIDFKDFTAMDYGKFDPRTFSLGSNLIHEVIHTHNGLSDPVGIQKFKETGPVVDMVNEMRAERGMPLRGPIYGGTSSGRRVEVPFIIPRPNAFLRSILGNQGSIRATNF